MIDFSFLEKRFFEIIRDNKSTLNAAQELAYIKDAITNKPQFHEATPQSIESVLHSIAAIGLSLSPAKQYCYIDVRRRKVNNVYVTEAVFDINYRGLVKLATESGCKYLRADVVRENDEFIYNGPAQKSFFKISGHNAFTQDRGEVVGAFAEVMLADGTVLTEIVSKEDLGAAGALSRGGSWKGAFADEMRKKVAIKRLFKTLPGLTPELHSAVQAADDADGVHLAEIDKMNGEMITDSTLDKINILIEKNGLDTRQMVDYVCDKIRNIEVFDQLTEREGSTVVTMLERRLEKQGKGDE